MAQTGTLTYTGNPLTAQVTKSPDTINNKQLTYTYSLTENGNYTQTVPAITDAGTHTVYFKISAEGINTVSGTFIVKIDPMEISEDSINIASKPYTGETQIATVPENVAYTVEKNLGGTISGDYEVVLKLNENGNYKWKNTDEDTITKKFTIYQEQWEPSEYTISSPNGNGWYNSDIEITAEEGYKISTINTGTGTWESKIIRSVEGENSEITFYLRNDETGVISLSKTESYNLDKNTKNTKTVGTISFNEINSWGEFLSNITYALFYNADVLVEVEASDMLSGVDKIEYIESETALSLEEVKNIENWNSMPAEGKIAVTTEHAKQFIYYVKITDKAGNVKYISSDGAEFDTEGPTIEGIVNGGTYYTTQKISITDRKINEILLDENTVTDANVTTDDDTKQETHTFTVAGNTDTTYTIKAIDEVGNSTTYTITMKKIVALEEPIKDLTEENVKSINEETIQDVIDEIKELLDDEDMITEEKESIDEIKENAEKLIAKIEEVRAAINTEQTKKITSENITQEDKEILTNAKKDLEEALTNYADNITEDEKEAVENEIKRIEGLLEIIKKVEDVEALIEALPDDITMEDNEDVNKAKDAYDNLTEHEKSLVKEESKEKLEEALEIINNVKEVEDLINALPEEIEVEDGDDVHAAKEAYDKLTEYEKELVGKEYVNKLNEAIKALEKALEEQNKKDNPSTGDNIMFYVVILAVSLIGIVSIRKTTKKGKH